MKRIIAYGNFRKGFPLSYYLRPMRERGSSEEIELSGLQMFVIGQAPTIKMTGNPEDKIVAELVESDISEEGWDAMLMTLDIVEGVPQWLYKRESVDTSKGKAVIYVFARDIPNGAVQITDWAEWEKKSEEEKEDLMSKGSEVICIRGL